MKKSSSGPGLFHLSTIDAFEWPLMQANLEDFLLSKSKQLDFLEATPLHFLCLFFPEKTRLAQKLLKEGADPNAQDRDLQTPLHYLTFSGKKGLELAEVLLEYNAKTDLLDKNHRTSFHYSLEMDPGLAQTLDEDKAKIFPLFQQALQNPDPSILNLLKEQLPGYLEDLCYQNLLQKNLPFVQDLLDKGCDPIQLLKKVISSNNPTLLDQLVELGLDPLQESKEFHPFSCACEVGAHFVIEHYLSLDNELLHRRDSQGMTPLHQASLHGRTLIVRTLLAKRAPIDTKDNQGKTPLFLACEKGQSEVAELLIKNGASLHLVDSQGAPPLLDLPMEEHSTIHLLLLEHGVSISDRSS